MIADDKAEAIPDDGKQLPSWLTLVLRGGDDPSANSDFDTVEDSPDNCGVDVHTVGSGFDGCGKLDKESNVRSILFAA